MCNVKDDDGDVNDNYDIDDYCKDDKINIDMNKFCYDVDINATANDSDDDDGVVGKSNVLSNSSL